MTKIVLTLISNIVLSTSIPISFIPKQNKTTHNLFILGKHKSSSFLFSIPFNTTQKLIKMPEPLLSDPHIEGMDDLIKILNCTLVLVEIFIGIMPPFKKWNPTFSN